MGISRTKPASGTISGVFVGGLGREREKYTLYAEPFNVQGQAVLPTCLLRREAFRFSFRGLDWTQT